MGDMNSKLGPEFIPNYPKQITENGKILAGILNGNQIPKLASMKYINQGLFCHDQVRPGKFLAFFNL